MLALLSGTRAAAKTAGRHASSVCLRSPSNYVGRHRATHEADAPLLSRFFTHGRHMAHAA
ncbi:MAG: hypothetical protein KBB39_07510 [Phycicoccus sp.]|nr:hypothetical protein [Phycicoccus sp.]